MTTHRPNLKIEARSQESGETFRRNVCTSQESGEGNFHPRFLYAVHGGEYHPTLLVERGDRQPLTVSVSETPTNREPQTRQLLESEQ